MIPPLGAHGGDGPRLAAELGIAPEAVLDLSMSLNPFAPDVSPLVAAHASSVRGYPDASATAEALARTLGVAPERVVLTNGGAEAIALVAAVWPMGRVDKPEFSLYTRHLRGCTPNAPRWRSNPNNPTGRLASTYDTAEVWDEAFYPLATGHWTRGDDAVIVGSLTKVFACPGLRVGYVVAPDRAMASTLSSHQPEWSVNALACAVVPELLVLADLPAWAAAIAAARTELVQLLLAHDLAPDPSDTNFLLVRDAPGLRTHLVRHAVLVRDTTNFGLGGGVRIAVPDAPGLDRLANALKGYR